ncbi:MAG TPA: hypothetical protein VLD59_08180 [Steroidobacteraceae bacterium]|nr:hypothetical protein [Steroidobacteraceae bacterium]
MSAQHTPGPWCIASGGTRFVTITGPDYSGLVAKAPKVEDARLIAAAPDLYSIAVCVEALLTRQRWTANGNDPESVLLRDARAAIAKATTGISK